MQAENTPRPDPLNRDQREEQDDATIATYRTLTRAALTAALPLLTAAPSEVETCAWCPSPARGSARHNDGRMHPSCGEVDHGQGWVPEATTAAPSATRDEVARTWIEAAPESGPGTWERASERVRERSLPRADALLARFTITPKEDR